MTPTRKTSAAKEFGTFIFLCLALFEVIVFLCLLDPSTNLTTFQSADHLLESISEVR